jgi:fused-like protein
MENYVIIQKLGEGSFGIVYKARKNGKDYVIKKIEIKNENLKVIENEIKFLQLITKGKLCEYAACLEEVFIDSKGYYRIVMDYIKGETIMDYIINTHVNDRINDSKPVIHLIKGLYEFHKLGLTHQDIKADNIMYNGGLPKYIDWGASCLKEFCSDRSKPCEFECGYSGLIPSPENELYGHNLIKKFETSICHDIWQLGHLLYYWYTDDGDNNMDFINCGRNKKGKEIPMESGCKIIVNKNQEYINENINKIKNAFAKKALSSMLIIDCDKRLEKWNDLLIFIEFIEKK